MKAAIRTIGVVVLIACGASVYYSVWMILLHWHQWPGNPNRNEWAVFFVLMSVAISTIFYLAYLGIRLTLADGKFLRRLGFVLIAEIAMDLIHFYVTWMILPADNAPITIGLWVSLSTQSEFRFFPASPHSAPSRHLFWPHSFGAATCEIGLLPDLAIPLLQPHRQFSPGTTSHPQPSSHALGAR